MVFFPLLVSSELHSIRCNMRKPSWNASANFSALSRTLILDLSLLKMERGLSVIQTEQGCLCPANPVLTASAELKLVSKSGWEDTLKTRLQRVSPWLWLFYHKISKQVINLQSFCLPQASRGTAGKSYYQKAEFLFHFPICEFCHFIYRV